MAEQVIIIGSGPAGLTAAIYAARAELKPLVVSGYERGGQLMITNDVENYPGFPEGVTGPDMMEKFRQQAERFGTRFIDRDVTEVDFSSEPFKVTVEDKTYEADSVIIATGAKAKWLGLESETEFQNRGVSACATCDGAFFKDKTVAVVGGGDTAMEEATFLTRYCPKVYVLHRRDELRASKIMQDRAFNNDKIEFIWNTEVLECKGEQTLSSLQVINNQTKEESDLEVQGMFLAIGHTPSTKIFEGVLDMDEEGYLVVNDHTKTKIPGVFVAGDVHDKRYRQAVTAAGFGCMAALDCEKYLEAKESEAKAAG